jgi:hypothetical protein
MENIINIPVLMISPFVSLYVAYIEE